MEKKDPEVVQATPERLEADKRLVRSATREIIDAIEPIVEKFFDKKTISLESYMDTFRVVTSYFMAQAVHSVPLANKPTVILKIKESFGPRIGTDLILVTIDKITKDMERFGRQNNSQSDDNSLT